MTHLLGKARDIPPTASRPPRPPKVLAQGSSPSLQSQIVNRQPTSVHPSLRGCSSEAISWFAGFCLPRRTLASHNTCTALRSVHIVLPSRTVVHRIASLMLAARTVVLFRSAGVTISGVLYGREIANRKSYIPSRRGFSYVDSSRRFAIINSAT